MRFILWFLLLSMFGAGCGESSSPGSRPTGAPPPQVFPTTDWARATPASQQVDSQALYAVLRFLEHHCRADGLDETLVIRNGYVLWAGGSTDRVHDVWSCTKSVTSSIAGLLVAEGRLALDRPLAATEPLLRPHYPTATLRHFLTMTSGYDAVGATRWPDAISEDWSLTPYDPAPPLFAPGTAYAYWDEAMIMLGRVLTRAADTTLNAYFHRRVGRHIGIPRRPWWGEGTTPEGVAINFGGTGLQLSAEEHARYGWLLLNEGMWDGRRLLPANWVQLATVNQVGPSVALAATDRRATDGRGHYGFNWWIIPAEGDRPAAYFSSGLHHNVCLVVPDWRLVLVRQGTDGNPDLPKLQLYTELVERLRPAIH